MDDRELLILRKRQEEKKQLFSTLEDGLYIEGELITFQKMLILDTYIFELPETWKQMPEDMAKVKYPSEFRPHRILTNEDLSIDIGISQFPSGAETENLYYIAKRMAQTLQKELNGIQLKEFSSHESKLGYWFAFRSHAMDSDLYNMMLITLIEDNLLQVSFNCPYARAKEWKPAVLLIWDSIRTMEEED